MAKKKRIVVNLPVNGELLREHLRQTRGGRRALFNARRTVRRLTWAPRPISVGGWWLANPNITLASGRPIYQPPIISSCVPDQSPGFSSEESRRRPHAPGSIRSGGARG
jgi:hypothetical protein